MKPIIDITQIPINKLLKDKEESLADIQNCQVALRIGVMEYSGGSVQERLDINQKIVDKINKELKRRKYVDIRGVLEKLLCIATDDLGYVYSEDGTRDIDRAIKEINDLREKQNE